MQRVIKALALAGVAMGALAAWAPVDAKDIVLKMAVPD